ncbi:amino acid/peptide transporter (Peptide:H+ symporter) [Edhazardia aedis USNM 41457]|uniref:Amino acid/peptide transporter (Peptide:H+ symporter) n=1 Tax=Edhazardia aedis (strain USNM 41457) TaxID=1003232 RepID=J9DBI8_EDHAE|nr:amino acid/peptide transporter (Peptide:H+ symporter) [Edhazardia aedis USNM 41457]|eukprot:EJW04859.1 amino acid/peptide transporter (Peptide:H+ symporter) [Edhazardia aedis USNM 41457]
MTKSVTKKITLALIVANEFCERYCFYGFRSLLFLFLKQSFKMTEPSSMRIVHFFIFSCYFFTFIGGIVSDTILGRYKTIIYMSSLYLIGTIATTISAFTTNYLLMWIGLILISIGTGGIKPCVSTFGGDQCENGDQKHMKSFFSAFYFSINAGSLISIFLSPLIAQKKCFGTDHCYPIAFGIPAVLLSISLLLFLFGSARFIKKEPDPTFSLMIFKILYKKFARKFTNRYAEYNSIKTVKISEKSGLYEFFDEEDEIKMEIKKAQKVLKIFAFIPFFWMIYDQQSTTWIEQGTKMKTNVNIFNHQVNIIPEQMQGFNGILILVFIPLFTRLIYPTIRRLGYQFDSIKKMNCGLMLASISFFISAFVEMHLEMKPCILWQVPQYIVLTAAEILLALTGMEFVYSESPERIKGLILSAWLITVAMGNFFVVIFTSIDIFRYFEIKNVDAWNYILYGMIGLAASYFFFKYSLSLSRSK